MSATVPPTLFLDAPAPSNRVLAGGIAASIALHVSLLVLFPGLRDKAPAAAPVKVLTATLGPRAASPEPPPSPAPEVKARVPEPPPAPKPQVKPPPPEPAKPVLTRPPDAPAPRAQEIPAPPPAPAAAAPPAPPQQTASAPPVAAAPRAAEPQAPAAAPSPVPGPQASVRPSDALDPGAADKYRLALIAAASRSKTYPRTAMEKGWQGKVDVRVVVSPFGNFRSVTIKTSSGHDILDAEALKIVRGAQRARELAVPDTLRGKEFTVDIPVIFDLKTG